MTTTRRFRKKFMGLVCHLLLPSFSHYLKTWVGNKKFFYVKKKEFLSYTKNELSFLVFSISFHFTLLIILHNSLSFIHGIFFLLKETSFKCTYSVASVLCQPVTVFLKTILLYDGSWTRSHIYNLCPGGSLPSVCLLFFPLFY